MVRSLAVVIAAVVVILLLTHRASPDPVREVDITSPLTVATMSASFPVLVPQGQEGYRLTSARWQTSKPPVWHLGYVTPDTKYVQLEQSATTNLKFVQDQLTGTTPLQATQIKGMSWQAYAGTGKNALVRTADGVTTAVTGTVPMPELIEVAGSLATQMKKPQLR